MVEIQRLWLLRVGLVPDRHGGGGERNDAAARPARPRPPAHQRHERVSMKPRHRRMIWIAAGLAALGVAATLVLNAFQSNLVFFHTPTQIANGEIPKSKSFRL